MREVSFHKGVNFVIDSEDSTRHNKVGKTTFLKLIDVLMGAQNRRLVYLDQETNSEVAELRDLINEKRVAVEMTLTQNLENPCSTEVELKVELFPRGRYFIDGNRLSVPKYREELNRLLFGIDNNIPTFRQLINSFVRVSVGGDDSAFLRTLPRASNATYRSVYNFLFGISDPALDNELSLLNTEINRTKESLKQYKRINGGELEQQRQVLIALEDEYSKMKIRVDDIFDSGEYMRNRGKIASARAEYARLTDRIGELGYRIERNDDAIASAEAEKNRRADLGLSRKFFDEVCSMLPSLNKTFEDMVGFNDRLCDNKIAYFKEIGADLEEEKRVVEEARDALLADNQQYLSLVTEDKIDEYEQLSSDLMSLKQDIGKRKEIVDTLERYERDLATIQDKIDAYSTGGAARMNDRDSYQAMMTSFNGFFTPLAQRINNEKPILVYSSDTSEFPVSITEISGSSTGTRKSLIAAFDFAYQQFAKANCISVPHFVVHDVVENVEGEDLNAVIEAANELDAQYVVAVLKEKLDSSNIPENEQCELQIIRLSDDDKLFEGKTVDDAEAAAAECSESDRAILIA